MQTLRMRLSALLALMLACTLLPTGLASAAASSAAKRTDVAGGPVPLLSFTVPAGTSATFETQNLTSSALTGEGQPPDTVLHVFEGTPTIPGAFLAGNDDCGGEVRSCVTLDPAESDREVFVVLRAFNSGRSGRADLRAAWAGFDQTVNHPFSGTDVEVGGSLPSGALVSTVEQNRRLSDPGDPNSTNTVLLTFDAADPSRPVSYNDDQAASNAMSATSIPGGCTSCMLFVGDAVYGPGGDEQRRYSTLIWDGGQTDAEADGLSDDLEAHLGTDPGQPDTDTDGIGDVHEVYGVQGWEALRYPYMGADPLRPDVFLEVDYVAGGQWTGPGAETTARAFRVNGFARQGGDLVGWDDIVRDETRDIAVHLDIGVANTARDGTRFVWNDWGGSNLVTAADWCAGLTPDRGAFRHWHHLLSGAGNSAGMGRCGFGDQGLTAGVHELGHQLGLEHGGTEPPGSDRLGGLNGNALYHSVMNYQFPVDETEGISAFSTQRYGPLQLNPTSLSEREWASSAPEVDLSYLRAFTAVRGRFVDWNQDNVFDEGSVRGQVNFGREPAKFFQGGYLNGDVPGGVLQDPAMTWLPGAPARLFMFQTERDAAGQTEVSYRTSTDLANCTSFRLNHWEQCNTFGARASVPGTAGVVGPIGVARYATAAGQWNLLVTYRRADDVLRFVTYDSGTDVWSEERTPPNAEGLSGSPIAERSPINDGFVRIYATIEVGGQHQVHRWHYDGASDTWSSTRTPQWYTGSPRQPVVVNPDAGIVPTNGHLAGGSREHFAAVALPGGGMEFARYIENSSDTNLNRRWERLPSLGRTDISPTTRPGFAYVPFTDDPSEAARANGRFYLAYGTPGARAGQMAPAIVKTIGNNPAVVTDPAFPDLRQRYLGWHPSWEWYHLEWDVVAGGMALSYDPDFDTNMRGAYGSGNSLVFSPIADGRANTVFNDYDDYKTMRSNLVASLQR